MKELLIALAVAWTSSGAAVSWQQPADFHGTTCLLKYSSATYPAGICWRDLPAGEQRIELPGIYHPGFYTPLNGDRYTIEMDGVAVGSATLGEARVYTTYLALVAKQNAPPEQRVYLGWVGR